VRRALRLVHLWVVDGTIACRGLTIADVARPLPDAPQITIYAELATCEVCRAAARRRAVA
jgi:hypothetical protein